MIKEMLGDTFGVIVIDYHSAYRKYHKNGLRQLYWAYLIRKRKAFK